LHRLGLTPFSLQLTVIKLDVPFKPKRYRLDPANPTATTLSQPDTLAQLAFIRECGDMAKHDGYKWAFFIDYDEYIAGLLTQLKGSWGPT
jgi:hypothetical protein